MATSAARRKKTVSAKPNSRGNEIIAIVLLAFAVLVFLCLVSYNPMDPTFNTDSSAKVSNFIGVVGANFAELLISLVGLTAYLMPALIVVMAFRVFRARDLRLSFPQVFGYALFVVGVSSLASLFGFQGGVIGAFFQLLSVGLIGRIGTGILFIALTAVACMMVTSLSLSSIFASFKMAYDNFAIHFREWREKRRERQAQLLAERDEAVDKITEKPSEVKSARKEIQPEPKPDIAVDDKSRVQIRDSVSTLFEDLREEAEMAAETVAAKITVEEDDEDDLLELPEEPFVPPTISGAEKTPEPDDLPPFPIARETVDMVAESERIPITPVQQTGELEPVDQTDGAPPEPVAKSAPNYDDYVLPTSDFLMPASARIEQKDEELLAIAQELTDKTKEFNVTGRVMHICQGPVVTTYEFKPDPGVKYSRVTGLADDLCLALKAESIRIDRIPGKAFVGIEVPNREREVIHLREVIESKKFRDSTSMLSIALGKSIDGLNYVADLAKMPHLLIAGATGAGKSVGVNSLIVSILYKARPDEVKLIMVDPKQVELGIYKDIPHLATPIITDPKRAAISLKWAVGQMERRYRDLAGLGVRNLDGYNAEVKRRREVGQTDDSGDLPDTLPYIVIIIDELADLMMVAGKDVEESITRLAQMARAVGIHLVLATQRPSVDVITGLIKANFPSRISFRVSSKVDSRTIIDSNGAESLLGRGDMLFLPPGTSNLVRVHGAFVDEKEIARIVDHVKKQGDPQYDATITKTEEELDDSGDLPGRRDPLFWDAVRSVVSAKRASTSLLQRHLRIGYGRAAAILDAMVREGYIGEMDGSTRARPILQKAYEDLQDYEDMNA